MINTDSPRAAAPTFWFVAGEASGDARAAEVMRAMRELCPDVVFMGSGGPKMHSLAGGAFDDWIARAAVLGLWDVLKNYAYFRGKFDAMLRSIIRERPDAVVLVDYPGFNLRMARALRSQGYHGKILYYISPQVWAWNRGRIPKMAKLLDLMICVFPFEAAMYEASGLHTIFVGHPLLEALRNETSPLPREDGLVGLFPGSREREVRRIFPVMVEAARGLSQQMPHLRFEAAAASQSHVPRLRAMAGDAPITITTGRAHDLMQRATVGVVCSGTATLEAAFFGLPYCLVYKIAWLTFEVGRHVVDLKCLGIINVLENYRVNPPSDPRRPASEAPRVVKEFIQRGATPEAISAEVSRLLADAQSRAALATRLQALVSDLHAEGASHRAAAALLRSVHSPKDSA